eukprot:539207-Amphidinium_carterae.2
MTTGTIPPTYMENGTDDKHSWYNFHTRFEYAIGDFLNIHLLVQLTSGLSSSRTTTTTDSLPYSCTHYDTTHCRL